MILLTIFLIIFVIIAYQIQQFRRFRRMINVFPGRSGHPIFGDVPNLSNKPDELFLQYRDLSREFPEGYRMWSVHHGVICINTPEHAEVILSSPKYIKKSILYRLLEPWLKTGLLTTSGKKWHQRRKLLTPAFHFNILQRMTSIFGHHNEMFIEQLTNECKHEKTNVVPLISKLALSIMCGASMGVLLDPNDKKQTEYRNAIHGFAPILVERAVRPWMFVDLIFLCSSLYQTQRKLLKVLHKFTKDVIEEREKSFDEDEYEDTSSYAKKRYAMLDLLLYAKRKHGEIDDAGIREEVDTFMFEGHDTVSMGLSFALMLIANHKEHQKKIVEELDNIFGDSDRPASYQDLQNMQYLEVCLKECLRLYPSVPFISRETEEDVPLGGEYIIPQGAIVHIHIYDIHRNAKIYPNPEKFDPSRFLPENSKHRHPYAYIPFSAGPRNCIGQRFAMLELKSIVSTILRHFEMLPVDTPGDIKMNMEMVLRPRDGVHIKFVPRKRSEI